MFQRMIISHIFYDKMSALVKFFIIFSLHLLTFPLTRSQTTSSGLVRKNQESTLDVDSCTFLPGQKFGNKSINEKCCNKTVENFHSNWSTGHYPLTTYLLTLRSWNCTLFEIECNNRFFVVNSFTRLVFDYFCNYTNFVDECIDVVGLTYQHAKNRLRSVKNISNYYLHISTIEYPEKTTSKKNESSILTEWHKLVQSINSSLFTEDELVTPCVQVALYEAEKEKVVDYYELIHFRLPTCPPAWNGFNGNTIRDRDISLWISLSSQCRAKILVFMAVCGILAIAVFTVNLSVIIVYVCNPVLLQSQSIYKLSLAIADLIVGFIVFPTFISSLYKIIYGKVNHFEFDDVTGFVSDSETWHGNMSSVRLRQSTGHISHFIDKIYLNMVGFFTVLSFLASVYILVVAGFDRLSAIYKPLSYRRDAAKKQAIVACVVIWCCGIIFALLPFFLPTLKYGIIASILVSSSGQDALILYAAAFLFPLVVMWIVTLAVYCLAQKHARIRRKMVSHSQKISSIDIRLAKTLSIMVGVFTLSIFPVVVVVLASIFIPSIYASIPKTFNYHDYTAYETAESVTIVILACNSLWNFFIYNARNEEFRQAFKKMYRKIFCNSRQADTGCACICFDGKRRLSFFSLVTEVKTSSDK